MKQSASGGGGYDSGCNDGLDVWGVSCDAPCFHCTIPYNNAQLPYELLPYNCYLTEIGNVQLQPDIFPRNNPASFEMFASRVPSTYPPKPGEFRPISSHDIKEWGVSLGVAGRHIENALELDALDRVTYCHMSRAIYVDGQQTWVAYVTGPFESYSDYPYNLKYHDEEEAIGYDSVHIINIAAQTKESWPIYGIGLFPYVFPFDSSTSAMEKAFAANYHRQRSATLPFNKSSVLNQWELGDPNWSLMQPPCNCISYGPNYAICSTYYPGKSTWAVARVKYDGTRALESGSEPGPEVFASECLEGDRIGDATPNGDYWIVLPSVRVYLDSTIAEDENPVCAIHHDYESVSRKIIAGNWYSKIYASGNSDWSSLADGTLSSTEVSNAVDILNTATTASHISGEDWSNLAIRCYNRVWDPNLADEGNPAGRNRHLMIFTSRDGPPDTYIETEADVVADFEGGDLNSGLEEVEGTFTEGGLNVESGWESTASVTYGSDTPINDSYSAHTVAVPYSLQQTLLLSRTFSRSTAGYITFNYRHHNRVWGTHGPGLAYGYGNFGVPENYLDIKLNGSVIDGETKIDPDDPDPVDKDNAVLTIWDGSDWALIPSSRIDNVTSPMEGSIEAHFTAARTLRIWVEAGTHTLSFVHNRGEDASVGGGSTFEGLYSQVDNINFGKEMIGEDTTGIKRWIFNGEKVQKAEWWAWPKRDLDEERNLANRVSTAPDFITLDKEGRILYGNPHYVVRLIPDEENEGFFKLDEDFGEGYGPGHEAEGAGDGGGYLRWTASPLDAFYATVDSCDDPSTVIPREDVIADPPWGSFQILPYGDGGDFQVRGVNANLEHDSTEYPFKEEDWTYYDNDGDLREERFYERLAVPLVTNSEGHFHEWSFRCSGWSVTNDGKHKRAHVEVVWRLTKQLHAYPPGPWNSPPFQSNFATRTVTEAIAFDATQLAQLRPRDPIIVEGPTGQAKWTRYNAIVAATYCDALSRHPQFVWHRYIDLDDEEDFEGYDPDVDGPLPSAEWQAVQARAIPTCAVRFQQKGPRNGVIDNPHSECEDEEEAPIESFTFGLIGHHETFAGPHLAPRTDFDVVDVQCNTCEC